MKKFSFLCAVLLAGLVFGQAGMLQASTGSVQPKSPVAESRKKYEPRNELFLSFENYPDNDPDEEGVNFSWCDGCDNNP